ncbi:MAG: alpha-glucosidase [Alphaproteobacteria bacterium]
MSEWWRGAVIYQIYPRSFLDTNGDGLGDLAGIERKLDYVALLGVDAVWLSPIFPSPQVDFGYDVSNYTDIEPDYGTLEEFDRLLAAAHARGLKVLLDQVLSHTSNEHPWFIESRSSRDNPKADWYVWTDPKDDGTAPNNWLAEFGGPAWSYWPERRQYYHHKFYREQPKLNLTKPEVADAVLKSVDFWLARGVDGFRLDVANSYIHDTTLKDNPPIPAAARGSVEWSHPPRMQRHTQDANRPDNWQFLEKLRAVIDRHTDRFVFGEISEEPERIGEYVAKGRLHSVYSFPFFGTTFAPVIFEDAYKQWHAWTHFFPCVTLSNHDVIRPVSRFAPKVPLEQRDDALAKLCLALLICLRGTVLMYQGEELGLPEADIPLARIKDPVGRLYYPLAKGRDGCRTPMPWQVGARNAGFTRGEPWLPIPEIHQDMAIDAQQWDDTSVLAFAREIVRWRKRHPSLARGDLKILSGENGILAFERKLDGERVLCAFNAKRAEERIPWPYGVGETLAPLPGDFRIEAGVLVLAPLSALITRV